jgi:hypothetical protein
MYKPVKTWGPGPWPFVDANVYIRDNLNSVRNFQVANTQLFADTAVTAIGTSDVQIAQHLLLFPATPDEAFEMAICAVIDIGTVVTAASVTPTILDHAATSILVGTPSFFVTTAASGAPRISCTAFALAQYGAGVNPGFTTKVRTNAGTVTAQSNCQVFLRPLA